MRLTLGDGRAIADPTHEGIEEALRNLEGGSGSFALLEDESEEAVDLFLQGAGGPEGFIIEYSEVVAQHEDEIEARHFRARQEVTHETLVVMFQSYALRDGTWKGMVAWEDTSADSEYLAEESSELSNGPRGATADPWQRRGGCLGLVSLMGLASLGLGLALGVWA